MDINNLIEKYSKVSASGATAIVYVYTFPCPCPVGKLTSVADDDYVYMVSVEDSKHLEKTIQSISKELSCQFVQDKNKVLQTLEKELVLYFEGQLKKFTVPIKTIGSEFQKEVWNKLLEVPYGLTQTYGDLAKSLGRSASYARAIGSACGANAHLLVIPCHRLVAAGSKGGFSCGIDRKEWLLQHEKKYF